MISIEGARVGRSIGLTTGAGTAGASHRPRSPVFSAPRVRPATSPTVHHCVRYAPNDCRGLNSMRDGASDGAVCAGGSPSGDPSWRVMRYRVGTLPSTLKEEIEMDTDDRHPRQWQGRPCVYYIRRDDRIKIGWTANLESRMRKLTPCEIL